MIKHIVLWKLKEGAVEKGLSQFKTMLEEMQGTVEGLKMLEIGVNSTPLDTSCDLVLYTVFDSFEALTLFQNHPKHLKIKQAAKQWVLDRHQVDYTC
jgi:heme-degrading monooxygenase HmoA